MDCMLRLDELSAARGDMEGEEGVNSIRCARGLLGIEIVSTDFLQIIVCGIYILLLLLQCSTVQYSAVQCSTVQYSARVLLGTEIVSTVVRGVRRVSRHCHCFLCNS